MYLQTMCGKNLTGRRVTVHNYLGIGMEYYELGVVNISMRNIFKRVVLTTRLINREICHTSDRPYVPSQRVVSSKFFGRRLGGYVTLCHGTEIIQEKKSKKEYTNSGVITYNTGKNPDKYDWGKLKRVLEYLKIKNYMKLTLKVDLL